MYEYKLFIDKDFVFVYTSDIASRNFNLDVLFFTLLSYICPIPPPPPLEILLVVWGLLFVLKHREPEHLKMRNFVKSASRGKEGIVRRAVSISQSLGNRRSSVTGVSSAEDEEHPAWDRVNATLPLPQPASPTANHRSSRQKPQSRFWHSKLCGVKQVCLFVASVVYRSRP